MRFIQLFSLFLLISFSFQSSCKVQNSFGTCLTASKCKTKGGKFSSTPCKGGKGIQCCTDIPCGQGGICGPVSNCNGKIFSGLCPGGADIKCCVKQGTSSSTQSTPSTQKITNSPNSKAQKIVAAAKAQVGKWKYSFAGGNKNGPSYGKPASGSRKCDDSKVKGFDCSGLALYAVYQGTGISIYHGASTQYRQAKNNQKGKVVPTSDIRAGDLVYFGGSTSDIKHVAIYIGNGKIVEAPGHNSDCSGMPVREYSLSAKKNRLVAAVRYWE